MTPGSDERPFAQGWAGMRARGGRLVVGNWKMNGTRAMLPVLSAIAAHARSVPTVEVGVAVPHPLIALAAGAEPDLAIGAQDVHEAAAGACTGSVSAEMVRDAGARFTIVGHSERRRYDGDPATLRAKIDRAAAERLAVVLCCGETREERRTGAAERIVCDRLLETLPLGIGAAPIVVAYEPCWAIGSGLRPTAEQIVAMHGAIERTLQARFGPAPEKVPILYGGSVDADSAAGIVGLSHTDGVLIGTASLSAPTFAAIVASVG